MPSFRGEKGVCPPLEALVDESAHERYKRVIEAGCRTSIGLKESWNEIVREAGKLIVIWMKKRSMPLCKWRLVVLELAVTIGAQ